MVSDIKNMVDSSMDSRILFLLGAALIWAALYAVSKVFPLEKYGIEMGPFLLALKTKRLNGWIEKTSERHPRLWRILISLGTLLSGGLCLGALFFLARNIYAFFYSPREAGAVTPLIPGLTIGLESLAYLLAPLIIVMFSHEFSHGIAARIEGIPIKSSGLIWAFILFGAFVEPDEESFRKSPWRSRLKVLAAGSAANIAVALFAFFLMLAAFQGPAGAIVAKVSPEGPAGKVGIESWDVVLTLNDTAIRTHEDLLKFLKGIDDNATVLITTNRGTFPVKVLESQKNGIGATFYILPYFTLRGIPIASRWSFYIYGFLSSVFALNFGVGLINMLPLYPFDGDGYMKAVLEGLGLSENLRKGIRFSINAIAVTLLISNILLTVMRIGYYLTLEI
ncbi:MAG: site-2 protease family protein [Candidatus Bathyarchaeia archaeon]